MVVSEELRQFLSLVDTPRWLASVKHFWRMHDGSGVFFSGYCRRITWCLQFSVLFDHLVKISALGFEMENYLGAPF